MKRITRRGLGDRIVERVMHWQWFRRRMMHWKFFRPGPMEAGASASMFSGERYDYPYLEEACRRNVYVMSCIKRISDTMQKIPMRVMRETKGGAERQSAEVFSGDGIGGDLVDLLYKPDVGMSWTDLVKEMASYIAFDGECPVLIDTGRNQYQTAIGRPIRLQALKPRFIEDVFFLPSGKVSHFRYRQMGGAVDIAPEFMIHPKGWNPFDDSRALPPIEIAYNPIRLKSRMAKYSDAFFKNGAVPGGILTSAHPLDESVKQENIAYWEEAHMGSGQAHRIAHLDADTTYQQISHSFKDIEFQGLEDVTAEEILSIFGVPPVLLGRFKWANYANSREQIAIFYEFIIQPMASLIANAIAVSLIEVWWPGQGLFIEFDFSDIDVLQEDAHKRAQRHSIYFNDGVMSADEIRAELNLPPKSETKDDTFKEPDGPVLLDYAGNIVGKGRLAPNRQDQWDAFDRQLRFGDKQFTVLMSRYFDQQMQRVLRRLAQQRSFPPDTDWERLRGAPHDEPMLKDGINPDDLFRIFDESAEAELLRQAAIPVLEGIIESAGKRAMRQTGTQEAFRVSDPLVKQGIKESTFHMGKDVNKTTKARIKKMIIDAAARDQSVGELATTIRSAFSEWKKPKRSRAVTIARTESANGTSFAANEAYRQSGVVEGAEWLTTMDGLERDSHGEINTEVAKLGSKFSNGLRYPGDWAGDPAERVNCRCGTLPVIKDS